MVRFRRVLVVSVLCVIAAIPAAGQQRGSVSGRVLDAGGLVLPGATVTVTEQSTGFNRTVVAAETGAYAVPNLDPGVYTIVVELPGFASVKQPDLALTAGSAVTLDLTLQVAGLRGSDGHRRSRRWSRLRPIRLAAASRAGRSRRFRRTSGTSPR